MSKLTSFNINKLGENIAGAPKPEYVLEGDPQFVTWPLLSETVSAGIWQATPGHHKIIRDQSIIEVFLILEGVIELYEEGQEECKHYSAGDLVVIHPGFKGSWRTLETVRKFYYVTENMNSGN